ncbi:Twin-arginine translocation protein TatB [hydrothermal vent metagenome]|uniref:Twin-arginine translocation protein TatB n=1 Tax=hydrothermal vent metagenome TaxID=652676 RepID=A0A3B0S2V7_9ZZZZ
MIPQIGFVELLILGVVALIVVGPKDLPALLRKLGALTAKAKRMAGEFRGAFDDMGREVELDELRKEIDAIKNANPVNQIKDELDNVGRDIDASVKD